MTAKSITTYCIEDKSDDMWQIIEVRCAYFLFDDLDASGQLKSLYKITFCEYDLQLPFHHAVLVSRIDVLLAAL